MKEDRGQVLAAVVTLIILLTVWLPVLAMFAGWAVRMFYWAGGY